MIESFKKNKKGILLMIISSICVCTGQLFWKLSTEKNSIIFLLLGFSLYGIGALVMIYAYKFGKLSILQPMLSVNYIFTIILAKTVLNEYVSLCKVIGISIIVIGVILIGGGD